MSTGITMGNVTGLYAMRTPSITPVSVAAASAVEQTFTVQGLRVSDLIFDITPPSDQAGLVASKGRATAPNTLAIKFTNPTAGAIVPVAGVYSYLLARFEPPQTLVAID